MEFPSSQDEIEELKKQLRNERLKNELLVGLLRDAGMKLTDDLMDEMIGVKESELTFNMEELEQRGKGEAKVNGDSDDETYDGLRSSIPSSSISGMDDQFDRQRRGESRATLTFFANVLDDPSHSLPGKVYIVISSREVGFTDLNGVLYAHWKYEWITKWTNNNQTDDMFSFFMDLSFPGYPETVRFLFDVDDTNEVSTALLNQVDRILEHRESNISSLCPNVSIGMRLMLPGDDLESGRVIKYNPSNGLHTLKYNEGKIIEVDLGSTEWRVIDPLPQYIIHNKVPIISTKAIKNLVGGFMKSIRGTSYEHVGTNKKKESFNPIGLTNMGANNVVGSVCK